MSTKPLTAAKVILGGLGAIAYAVIIFLLAVLFANL